MNKRFSNHQWRIVSRGITTVPGEPDYCIPAAELSDTTTRDGITYYDWPLQLAGKNWVSLPAFVEVFREALREFRGRYNPPLDEEMLARSIKYARARRQ